MRNGSRRRERERPRIQGSAPWSSSGAKAVIASLWAVADHSTALLLHAFYCERRSGLAVRLVPPASAARAARRRLCTSVLLGALVLMGTGCNRLAPACWRIEMAGHAFTPFRSNLWKLHCHMSDRSDFWSPAAVRRSIVRSTDSRCIIAVAASPHARSMALSSRSPR